MKNGNGSKNGNLPPQLNNLGYYMTLEALQKWNEEGKIENLGDIKGYHIDEISPSFLDRAVLRRIRLFAPSSEGDREVVRMFGKFYSSDQEDYPWRMSFEESMKYQYFVLKFLKENEINMHEPIDYLESEINLGGNGSDGVIKTSGLLSEYLHGVSNDIHIIALLEAIRERERDFEDDFKVDKGGITLEKRRLENTLSKVTESILEKMNILMHNGSLNLGRFEGGEIYNPEIDYYQYRLKQSLDHIILWARVLQKKISPTLAYNFLIGKNQSIELPNFEAVLPNLVEPFRNGRKLFIHGDEHPNNFQGQIYNGYTSSEAVDTANTMMGKQEWALAKLLSSSLTGYKLEEIKNFLVYAREDFTHLSSTSSFKSYFSEKDFYKILSYELICAMGRQAENKLIDLESSDKVPKRGVPYHPKFIKELNPSIREIPFPQNITLREYGVNLSMMKLQRMHREVSDFLLSEKRGIGLERNFVASLGEVNQIFDREGIYLKSLESSIV